MRKARRDTQNEEVTLLRFCVRESRSRCTENNQVRLLAVESFWLTIVAFTFSTSTMKAVSSSRVSLNLVVLEVDSLSSTRFE